MSAYYNEFDPKAAAWLRELIKAGVIADGEVDERDIRDVEPRELAGFRQLHLFAGIGVWSYALRRGGFADDTEILTVSCPCQPFSAAGARAGEADERHLWPAAFHIIGERRPRLIFGEQVASKDGLAWLDLVSADMEAAGYAFGALDLCAAGVGAPNIRQRLYFNGTRLDDAAGARLRGEVERAEGEARDEAWLRVLGEGVGACGVALSDGRQCDRITDGSRSFGDREASRREQGHGELATGGELYRMADADGRNACPERQQRGREHGLQPQDGGTFNAAGERPGPVNGFWRASDWLHCRDARWRPVEPGTFPLADGIAGRVGLLRGYGNALNAEVATEFVKAVRGVIGC